ncbi:MAG: divergent PAP2 family protein [Chloroflexi bacterium]|jgi:acid phosphatase family membrane protein YuiD|nr:divergent PAP2 family protein [Chloroflexota bacterium]
MPLTGIFQNPVFIATLVTSLLAQVLKLPLSYLHTREWDLSLLVSTGGMPSSHSAVVTAAAAGIGYYAGFNTPLFGLAFAIASVVIYDATNIRRQAGFHAQQINRIIKEMFVGEKAPVEEFKELREVLGHSPAEALGGVILGLLVNVVFWQLWP